jgi:hypothetical protein
MSKRVQFRTSLDSFGGVGLDGAQREPRLNPTAVVLILPRGVIYG